MWSRTNIAVGIPHSFLVLFVSASQKCKRAWSCLTLTEVQLVHFYRRHSNTTSGITSICTTYWYGTVYFQFFRRFWYWTLSTSGWCWSANQCHWQYPFSLQACTAPKRTGCKINISGRHSCSLHPAGLMCFLSKCHPSTFFGQNEISPTCTVHWCLVMSSAMADEDLETLPLKLIRSISCRENWSKLSTKTLSSTLELNLFRLEKAKSLRMCWSD